MTARLILVFFITVCLAGCATTRKKTIDEQINSIQTRVTELEKEQSSQDAEIADLKIDIDKVQVKAETAPSSNAVDMTKTKKNIQRALKNAGYYNASIDGKIGAKTKKAITDFQKDHGLKVDGIVGTRTWARLKEYL